MYEQRLPIEEWKAKKQAELKETIAAQRSALQEVVQDGQRLADYLYGRGRLGSHITSGNAALVLQTLPQARAVLTAKEASRSLCASMVIIMSAQFSMCP